MNNFEDVNKFLEGFVPGAISDPGVYTLDKMKKLMPLLGLPQERLKVIHVAGTSGKTSTAYYLASILSKTGAKVGLSVSPHIYEVNERVQINNIPLDEKEYCQLFNRFISIDGVIGLKPSYFELLVAFAYWLFNELGCDYVVMEVGLGGLIDGTNVIQNPNKIAVITDIGLDHTRILGHTIQEIARQKAGIIFPSNHVFALEQSELINNVFKSKVEVVGAQLHTYSETEQTDKTRFIPKLPSYQQRNWLLASKVVNFIAKRDNLTLLDQNELFDSQRTVVPGRMQTFTINDQKLIFDGGHNPQKLKAMVTSVKKLYPEDKVSVLVSFGVAKSESVVENLGIIKELTDHIIVTEFSIVEDYHHKSMKSKELEAISNDLGFIVRGIPDPAGAFDMLLQEKADILLVTGSFYLISSIFSKRKVT